MPELPDLLYILSRLRERLLGRTVTAERVGEPVVLRFAVQGNLSLLLGRALATAVALHVAVSGAVSVALVVHVTVARRHHMIALPHMGPMTRPIAGFLGIGRQRHGRRQPAAHDDGPNKR